jgi:hypothetical protein
MNRREQVWQKINASTLNLPHTYRKLDMSDNVEQTKITQTRGNRDLKWKLSQKSQLDQVTLIISILKLNIA